MVHHVPPESSSTHVGRRRTAGLVASLGMVLALGACATDAVTDGTFTSHVQTDRQWGTNQGQGLGQGQGQGGASSGEQGASGEHEDLAARVAALPNATLTSQEIDGLQWMREEEKLAHDVYVTLGGLWGNRVFENVSRAETTHTEAVKTLLDRYGIADPAAGKPIGIFTDPAIQKLYDDLVARGRTSVVDAMAVGAIIEDLDINDLQRRATTTPDIALVYDELERGSENHLRAFVRNLDRQGASYTPAYISQEEFDSIISSPTERGITGLRVPAEGAARSRTSRSKRTTPSW